MKVHSKQTTTLILCALGICINVILGSFITYTGIPFLYLDAIGTIFIAANFPLRYGLLTGLGTNLMLALIHGPLALPFALVSLTVALVTNLSARKNFSYPRALITGILVTLIGSLVSAPIRLLLFGGFGGVSPSMGNVIVFALSGAGQKAFFAAYLGAVTDGLLDKIISCLLTVKLSRSAAIQQLLNTGNLEGSIHE